MVAKGKENAFCVNGSANTTLTATKLNESLASFTNATGCEDIVVVYDANCSGSFIYELSGPRRIIVTSTNITTPAPFDNINGGFFSHYFFNYISVGKTIKEAFEYASNSREIQYFFKSKNRTPLLDDNGDGVGEAITFSGDGGGVLETSYGDGSFATFKYIGIRYSASPPTITNLIPSQTVVLNEPIDIWAVVVSDSSIKEVYALITELNSSKPSTNDNQTNLTLEDQDGDGNYTASFTPTKSGKYTLTLCATDEEGNEGLAKQCFITAVLSLESAIFDNGEQAYTYPWKGTGGHSEYEKIWNSTWKGAVKYFLGREITRQEFMDMKGHLNNNWIPAIKVKEV
jgi:hypothetical protein